MWATGGPRPTERGAVVPGLSSLPTWADSPLHYLMCDHGRVAHTAPRASVSPPIQSGPILGLS